MYFFVQLIWVFLDKVVIDVIQGLWVVECGFQFECDCFVEFCFEVCYYVEVSIGKLVDGLLVVVDSEEMVFWFFDEFCDQLSLGLVCVLEFIYYYEFEWIFLLVLFDVVSCLVEYVFEVDVVVSLQLFFLLFLNLFEDVEEYGMMEFEGICYIFIQMFFEFFYWKVVVFCMGQE